MACAAFPEAVGQRLLGVDVLATLHRVHGRYKMGVVRSADDDGIDLIAQFIEHDTEVLECLGMGDFGESLHVFPEFGGVDIAQGNDIFVLQTEIRHGGDATSANQGDIDFAVCGRSRFCN